MLIYLPQPQVLGLSNAQYIYGYTVMKVDYKWMFMFLLIVSTASIIAIGLVIYFG